MNWLNRLFSRAQPVQPEQTPAPRRKKTKRLSAAIRKMPPNRVKHDMQQLTLAAESALSPQYNDRSLLLSLYESTVKDSQYISEREKAEAYLITEPFEICLKGGTQKDEERTALFQRPWFTEFLGIALDVEFWGYTLVEFGQMDARGEFVGVSVFPRHHVRPFDRMITRYPDEFAGISYDGRETEYFLLELGDPNNLGKLESITVETIWKIFARSDWSEYNERFGKPFVIYKTDSDDEHQRDENFEMAQKFGADLVGVIGTDETLDVIDITSKASAENYHELAKSCDEYISKIVNGQTGTSDVKSYTGSAEVHERVLTEFTKARLKRIQDVVNYNLFPFLAAHGYRLEGYEFQFVGLRSTKENTIGNKSLNSPNTTRRNERNPENDVLGFFA